MNPSPHVDTPFAAMPSPDLGVNSHPDPLVPTPANDVGYFTGFWSPLTHGGGGKNRKAIAKAKPKAKAKAKPKAKSPKRKEGSVRR